MYGTVSRYRLKPGKEQEAITISGEIARNPSSGFVGTYTFRLDSGDNEYITAAVWSDRETYQRNSNSQQQQRWFQRVSQLMDGDPQWHDGEVIDAQGAGDQSTRA